MQIQNDFEVDASAERVWALLVDIEQIAPCIPGFQLQEIEGDEYRGVMKLKVGSITAEYKVAIEFRDRDDQAMQAVLVAKGKETKGQGGVDATVTTSLTESGGKTAATVNADVNVSGRLGQFGRNVLADVSARLTEQFVRCLETRVLSPAGGS
ncbi:MAG: SRPBCC family protein [Actinobacteria bacterium]|nr:SRPBCC family protein [Actinomycetota bacterium]